MRQVSLPRGKRATVRHITSSVESSQVLFSNQKIVDTCFLSGKGRVAVYVIMRVWFHVYTRRGLLCMLSSLAFVFKKFLFFL